MKKIYFFIIIFVPCYFLRSMQQPIATAGKKLQRVLQLQRLPLSYAPEVPHAIGKKYLATKCFVKHGDENFLKLFNNFIEMIKNVKHYSSLYKKTGIQSDLIKKFLSKKTISYKMLSAHKKNILTVLDRIKTLIDKNKILIQHRLGKPNEKKGLDLSLSNQLYYYNNQLKQYEQWLRAVKETLSSVSEDTFKKYILLLNMIEKKLIIQYNAIQQL